MIGVSVAADQAAVTPEFFELCKTAWEYWQPNHLYEVVMCVGETRDVQNARLLLIFSGTITEFDSAQKLAINQQTSHTVLCYDGKRLPIYGASATFPQSLLDLATEEETGEPMIDASAQNGVTVARIGYNIFEEIRILLGTGQPVGNASIPTLELHLRVLRDLITRAGLPFVEIPPLPDGYRFIACLTHDVDHPLLRNHCCDHTMFGFLY